MVPQLVNICKVVYVAITPHWHIGLNISLVSMAISEQYLYKSTCLSNVRTMTPILRSTKDITQS